MKKVNSGLADDVAGEANVIKKTRIGGKCHQELRSKGVGNRVDRRSPPSKRGPGLSRRRFCTATLKEQVQDSRVSGSFQVR